jgi:hypothetical protein
MINIFLISFLGVILKLIRRDELNYLIYILTLPLACGFKLSLNKLGSTHEIFN